MMVSSCALAFTGTSGSFASKPFLLSSISNNQPYVGQEILLTYKLYFKDAAPKISNEATPFFQTVWAKESTPERYINSVPATIQGQQFRAAVVKQFKLIPIQSGIITISGYSMLCTLQGVQPVHTENNLPDTQLQLKAPDITISARALPEPVPEGFTGAVGTFHFELLVDKQNIRVGEPLTFKQTITGTGNLFILKIPDLLLPESFRQQPPDITTAVKNRDGNTSGTITSTVITWPQSQGDFTIPSFRMVAFNPETNKFYTLFTKPLSIRVVKAIPTTTATEEDSQISYSGKSMTNYSLFISMVIALLILLTFITIFIIRKKRRQRQKKTPSGSIVNHDHKSAKSVERLKQQFFSVLEEGGIISPRGLTRKEFDDELKKIGIPEEVRTEIHDMLDAFDRVIYSPAANSELFISEGIELKINTLLNQIKNFTASTLNQSVKK